MKKTICAMLISSAILTHITPAQARDNTYPLKFEKGKISTIVTQSVIRGDRDSYSFKALAGQNISLAISSIEDNAVFDMFYQKNSKWLPLKGVQEKKVWYGKLPQSESNQYLIKVGGTRGNTSYELFVGISVVH